MAAKWFLAFILFFSGIFLTIWVIGPLIVFGHLAVMDVAAVEGAIPKNNVIKYK